MDFGTYEIKRGDMAKIKNDELKKENDDLKQELYKTLRDTKYIIEDIKKTNTMERVFCFSAGTLFGACLIRALLYFFK